MVRSIGGTTINSQDLEDIVEAGVAALKLQELTQDGLDNFNDLNNEEAWMRSRQKAEEFIKSGHGQKVVKEANEKRANECLAWIEEQKCSRETLFRRVLTHMTASFLVAVIGFVILVCLTLYQRTHSNDPSVKAANEVVNKAVNIMMPETGKPDPSSSVNKKHPISVR